MDETAIWADMPANTANSTVDVRGSTSVPILTNGHEKQRITVCLATMADGSKLLPFVALKGKRLPKNLENLPNVIVRMSKNAWMNEELTSQWIAEVHLYLQNECLYGAYSSAISLTQLKPSSRKASLLWLLYHQGAQKLYSLLMSVGMHCSKHSITTFTVAGWKKANMI